MNRAGRRFRLPAWADSFMLGIIGAMALSTVTAPWGASSGPLGLGRLASLGIALVFFLHGVKVSRERLHAGSRNLRLHLLIQSATYLWFPAVGFAAFWLLSHWVPAPLALGFFYVCALPSTIASAVTMVGIAGGNVAAAVFNATLSGLIGIVLTPTLVGLVASSSGIQLPYLAAMQNLAVQVLLPFALGHALQRWFLPQVNAWPRLVRWLDRGAIVLVIYVAFCDAVQADALRQASWQALLLVFVATGLVLAGALSGTRRWARRQGFPIADEITAVFCGSQKSLANGMPMAKVLFGSHPALGLVVLPMIVYHQAQLIVCAMLARRYARLQR